MDYIAVLLFIAGVFIAGMVFSGRQRDVTSFFSAGGAMPWGICGLSLFMGFFSAGTFVVWGSIGYSHGLVAVVIQETMCLAGIAVAALIAPRWHATGALTPAGYVSGRFGSKARKAYSITFLAVSLFLTASFLYPVARMLSLATGISLTWGLALIALLSILYVSLGGLWSVVITDILQFIVLTVAVLVVAPLSIEKAGGLSGFLDSAPAGFFNVTSGEYTCLFLVSFGIYNVVSLGGNWAFVQRYTSVKSGRDASKAALLFAVLYLVSPVLWMIPSMAFRVSGGQLAGLQDEGAFMMMCRDVLPEGLLGMMLAGLVFATVSSFNQVLNISSSVITNDIVPEIRADIPERSLMRVARVSTAIFGVSVVAIALLVPEMGGLVNVVISIGALTGVPLYLPLIWSLFSHRQTSVSILTVTFLSITVNLFLKFVFPVLSGSGLSRAWEMTVGVVLPALLLALWEVIAMAAGISGPEYVPEVHDVSMADDSDNDNAFGLKVIGAGMMTTGGIVSCIGMMTDHHRLFVTLVGMTLCIPGLLLIKKSKTINPNLTNKIS